MLLFRRKKSKDKLRKGYSFNSPEYRAWINMKKRCYSYNPKQKNKLDTEISDSWMKSFNHFIRDMGAKPKNSVLRRNKESLPYCKENCFWQPLKARYRTSKTNHYIEYEGEIYILKDLLKKLSISRGAYLRNVAEGLPLRFRKKPGFEKKVLEVSNIDFTGDKKKDILMLREKGFTLDQIGKLYGMSRQGIQQKIKRLLTKKSVSAKI